MGELVKTATNTNGVGLQEEIAALREQLAVLEHRVQQRYRGPLVPDPPVRESGQLLDSGHDGYQHRLLVATPGTGLVRLEWHDRRLHQLIPPNWSMVDAIQYMNGFIVMRYQIADAQNLIAQQFIEGGNYEWLFLLEHDVILPNNALMLLDEWMESKRAPVVSGLYYTRSRPSEPLVYRGRGTRYYGDWKHGDEVWCDGVPTGALLIHRSILQVMWDESEEYIIQHPNGRRDVTRKVFEFPRKSWFDPESGQYEATTGTSDLYWCERVMNDGIFAKAGWAAFQDERWPFVVDTRLFCRHINPDGEQFP